MIKEEILQLELMTDNEKDFNKKFENLLKSKKLKIISFTKNDKITVKNSDYPYNIKKKFINSKIKYLLNNKILIILEINKVYWDDIPQSFEIYSLTLNNTTGLYN